MLCTYKYLIILSHIYIRSSKTTGGTKLYMLFYSSKTKRVEVIVLSFNITATMVSLITMFCVRPWSQ